ncbi:MAG: histidinol-phosphate transaminase [Ruminococcaceae bacterium]|nr:histidinol-phosphate transaminase [Oscillospiraceae bacterium]
MNKYIPEKIKVMQEYVPDTSCPEIKLDANESPFDTPEEVLRAIKESVSFEDINRYPDPDMTELLNAYGDHIGTDKDHLVAGDGSDELIALTINTFLCDGGKLLICEPDFSMYKFYAEFSGCETVSYKKKDGMDIDFAKLKELCKEENCKMVLLSNPCNPTGVMYGKETVMDFVRSIDAVAVIDEAYMEFAPRCESVLGEIDNCDNLIVLKTVSKIGLAGLRCGFAVSNKELISALKKTKSPYNLNSVTQKAVAVALRNYRAIGANVEQIKLGTERLYDIVKKQEKRLDFEVRPSSANFVLLRFKKDGAARKIWVEMKNHGISLRISGNTLRITAGTSDEIDRFEEVFKKLEI